MLGKSAAALLLCLIGLELLPVSRARGGDVLAEPPSSLALTVYRAPSRGSGSLDLDALQGFALVTETRRVILPAGRSRLRFAGVADGIEAESAIVSGLPSGLIEKNQDARLLTPSALQLAAVGKPLELVRRNRKTGVTTRLPVTLQSAGFDGVIFKTPEGLEAWKCSGLSESLTYTSAEGLSSAPTLSVLIDAPRPIVAQVTLSYLARGFDWFAQYSAELSADGEHLQLGAWVTLANGNAVGFAGADTKVVAGRVNHDTGAVEPISLEAPVVARCWPQQTTSDLPLPEFKKSVRAELASDAMLMKMVAAPAALQEVAVTAARQVTQEQLGDLKLYSVPDRTTVAARQSKQVRLLDRAPIPVAIVYGADLVLGAGAGRDGWVSPRRLIRTRNTAANHLGLALPSGRIAVYERASAAPLLIAESEARDQAVGEDVEFDAGASEDVQVHVVDETREVVRPPRVELRTLRVEVSNARRAAINVELKLRLADGASIAAADHSITKKNGLPLFKLEIPAGGTEAVGFSIKSR